MTDIKKIAQISDEAIPEFPTSRRSGYVEDSVDKWLTEHYEELRQIIEYQNYCVDVAEEAENKLADAEKRAADAEGKLADAHKRAETAEGRVAAAEARVVEAEAAAAEATTLAGQWEDAYHDLEAQPAQTVAAPVVTPVEDSIEREAAEVSTLLQNATRLAREHVEQAQVDAGKIRENAENEVHELRREIERLSGERYAAYHTLSSFYTNELQKLNGNPIFADLNNADQPAENNFAAQEAVALEEAEEQGYELESPTEEPIAEEFVVEDHKVEDEGEDDDVITVVDDEEETRK